MQYLDLKMDFMFKQMFGQPSRKSITMAFLNALLHRKEDDRIVDVQFENTELTKETEDGKTGRLDVIVRTNLGERIHVEIQIIPQYGMPERLLYLLGAAIFVFAIKRRTVRHPSPRPL
ncbi:hypothetical protein GFC30_1978 [Anoxybacillus amylolyticus]|uniref:PD-(D/E)XK nuclease transposase family protein n=1 Tax=Anoxybacteroides amylolyticum TaxID=294699 RepID=A0A160F229_9BACL|nr:hypothetical protein GFC30_1978 [Anoxybacillus amylolyticus]